MDSELTMCSLRCEPDRWHDESPQAFRLEFRPLATLDPGGQSPGLSVTLCDADLGSVGNYHGVCVCVLVWVYVFDESCDLEASGDKRIAKLCPPSAFLTVLLPQPFYFGESVRCVRVSSVPSVAAHLFGSRS